VVIGATKELTHGSGLDRKPIRLGTTVPRPIDFSCQVPLLVLVLNCHCADHGLLPELPEIEPEPGVVESNDVGGGDFSGGLVEWTLPQLTGFEIWW